jgi:two-component system sensor histidine kinase/response regulator
VEDIIESTKLITTIIGNVLDISKIEAGKVEFTYSPMSILSLVESTAETYSAIASKKGLILVTFVDPALPHQIIAPAKRISQILNNFTSNAIKFTKSGYVFVSALLASSTKTHTTIEFKCKDTGIGIAKENYHRIFKDFVQLNDKKSPTFFEGWGLGLSITKKLAGMMNGTITFESELGKGSTFSFTCTFENNGRDTIRDSLKPSLCKKVFVCLNDVFYEPLCTYLKALGVETIHTLLNLSEVEKFPKEYIQESTLIIGDKLEFEKVQMFQKIIIIGTNMEISKRIPLDLQSRIIVLREPVRLYKLMDSLSGKRRSLPSICGDTLELFQSRCREKQLSILIVEDNPVIQSLLKNLLRKSGIKNITCASNGKEAVEIVEREKEPFSTILMDLQMPIVSIKTPIISN